MYVFLYSIYTYGKTRDNSKETIDPFQNILHFTEFIIGSVIVNTFDFHNCFFNTNVHVIQYSKPNDI